MQLRSTTCSPTLRVPVQRSTTVANDPSGAIRSTSIAAMWKKSFAGPCGAGERLGVGFGERGEIADEERSVMIGKQLEKVLLEPRLSVLRDLLRGMKPAAARPPAGVHA